jgi:hypothetical protein
MVGLESDTDCFRRSFAGYKGGAGRPESCGVGVEADIVVVSGRRLMMMVCGILLASKARVSRRSSERETIKCQCQYEKPRQAP